jgi:hypothetical protein
MHKQNTVEQALTEDEKRCLRGRGTRPPIKRDSPEPPEAVLNPPG